MSLSLCGSVKEAYEAVRSDSNSINWALFEYKDQKNIYNSAKGENGFQELISHFKPDNRCYAYVRFNSGDEMSSRAKFVFIVWVGESVGPLQKARVSTDRQVVKEVIQNFSYELFATSLSDLDEKAIEEVIMKNTGANYGSSIN